MPKAQLEVPLKSSLPRDYERSAFEEIQDDLKSDEIDSSSRQLFDALDPRSFFGTKVSERKPIVDRDIMNLDEDSDDKSVEIIE